MTVISRVDIGVGVEIGVSVAVGSEVGVLLGHIVGVGVGIDVKVGLGVAVGVGANVDVLVGEVAECVALATLKMDSCSTVVAQPRKKQMIANDVLICQKFDFLTLALLSRSVVSISIPQRKGGYLTEIRRLPFIW
jgi:hypothetical protein